MKLPPDWIVPDWPAPSRVRAFVTTRSGGESVGEYATMNLGGGSGDDPARVARNRLAVARHLPEMPLWLRQRHGVEVARIDGLAPGESPIADAAVAASAGRVCAVLTGDCLPLLLCNTSATSVAAVHAGWRGLAAGVVEEAVAALGADPSRVLAWMGPAIGAHVYEVGSEVRETFLARDPDAKRAFEPRGPGKYLADLYHLARQRLERAGVSQVHGGGYCTYTQQDRFFSYRRVAKSGRMGTFIWMDA